jgi:hypothetical protein
MEETMAAAYFIVRATVGEDMKCLVADFNRDWPDVSRTREVLVLAEEFSPS